MMNNNVTVVACVSNQEALEHCVLSFVPVDKTDSGMGRNLTP